MPHGKTIQEMLVDEKSSCKRSDDFRYLPPPCFRGNCGNCNKCGGAFFNYLKHLISNREFNHFASYGVEAEMKELANGQNKLYYVETICPICGMPGEFVSKQEDFNQKVRCYRCSHEYTMINRIMQILLYSTLNPHPCFDDDPIFSDKLIETCENISLRRHHRYFAMKAACPKCGKHYDTVNELFIGSNHVCENCGERYDNIILAIYVHSTWRYLILEQWVGSPTKTATFLTLLTKSESMLIYRQLSSDTLVAIPKN